ncbi:MAG: RapZ C-terminal domain-containing protein [Bacteroidales bacterium]
MKKSDPTDILRGLFTKWAKEDGIEIAPLPQAGSDRKYYRLTGQLKQAIGVYSPDKNETQAFITFTEHFMQHGLNVPEIFCTDLINGCYLISDLGNISLLDHLEENRINGEPSDETLALYKKVIAELPRFQVDACKDLNFSVCYPSAEFDGRSMRWDLNYFKYYFLRLLKIPFNEAALEDDFDRLVMYLLRSGSKYFMYRDFQARNIMIHEGKPWFIDFQGGRRGPLQYDLASLLFQVKASLPYPFREEMLHWYLENLRRYIRIDENKFIEDYYGFVLIRLLQVMGAYGFRGYFERRAHFLKSIPYAVENLRWLLSNVKFRIEMPELIKALDGIAKSDFGLIKDTDNDKNLLTVSVSSFSYKNGAPPDYSGNGGGFVFDCRALPNPGRYDHYKKVTGIDEPVIQYLSREPLVAKFLQNAFKLIDQSILEYQKRGFIHLQIDFGCTGGQHRSVYCASRMAAYIDENYSVKVEINHNEMKNFNFQ